ncbi:MAG: hypothetical protein IJ504_08020 [Bacteroidales bacterium]|nr:hypothetical protein [Bacteroidales bacterium]
MKVARYLCLIVSLVMMAFLAGSCEKKPVVSEAFVGDWDGIFYYVVNMPDKALVITKVIELDINEDGTYVCTFYDFQSPGGIPVKVGEGNEVRGKVIEGESTLCFSNMLDNSLFTVSRITTGLFLESPDYALSITRVK